MKKSNDLLKAHFVNNRVLFKTKEDATFLTKQNVADFLNVTVADVDFNGFSTDKDGDLDLGKSFTATSAEEFIQDINAMLQNAETVGDSESNLAEEFCKKFNQH